MHLPIQHMVISEHVRKFNRNQLNLRKKKHNYTETDDVDDSELLSARINDAIPHTSMSHDGSLLQVPSMSVHVPTGMPQLVGSNSKGLPNKLSCSCEKGGSCFRAKHFEGQTCDRTVTITKHDRHKRCFGCRITKNRKTGILVDSRNISQMDIPMVPIASVGRMVSMNQIRDTGDDDNSVTLVTLDSRSELHNAVRNNDMDCTKSDDGCITQHEYT